jgi:hypothetical protein
MKLIILAFAMLLDQYCHANDLGWQIDKSGDSTSVTAQTTDKDSGVRIAADISESAKAVSVFSLSADGKDTFVVSVLSKQDNLRESLAARGKLPFSFSLLKLGGFELRNEGAAAIGILRGSYSNANKLAGDAQKPDIEFIRHLYGVRNELVSGFSIGRSQFGLRAGAEIVGADLSDDYGKTGVRRDNYGLRFGAFAGSQFSKDIFFRISADGWRKKYDPENYFFTEKWASETKILSETAFLADKNVELVSLLGYRRFDLERDGQADLEELQYGGRLVYKTNDRSDTRLFLNAVRASKFQSRGSENLISAGVGSKNLSAEIYQRQTIDSYSDFKIKERTVAVSLSWKFGAKPKSLESSKSVKEKYSFYLDSGNEDVRSLTLKQQAERLQTLRKQSEWERDLNYAKALNTGFRYAEDVYKGRAGDCDEQACMSNTMGALNGYKGYAVAWYDRGKSMGGHAVKVVQDPGSKQWFFVEYGMTYKVNVPSDASVTDVAAEAVRQNHMNSALPLAKAIDPRFAVIDCSDGRTYSSSGYMPLKGADPVERRPNVERGVELFTSRDFLFD